MSNHPNQTFSGIGIFEQGAGKLDLLKAYQLLNSYTPQVRREINTVITIGRYDSLLQ